MTIQEFQQWQRETAQSRIMWLRDGCFETNRNLILFAFYGGEKGSYVEITQDGEATVGTYEEAIPHIGEASFKVAGRRKFENTELAFKAVCELMGSEFTRHIICGA